MAKNKMNGVSSSPKPKEKSQRRSASNRANANTQQSDFVEKRLEKCKEQNTLMWGKVVGEEIKDDKLYAIVQTQVAGRNVSVKIEDACFFESTYRFGKDYDTLSEEDQIIRRQRKIRTYKLANVPFFIINIVREKSSISATGTRCIAMKALREHCFLGKKRERFNLPEYTLQSIHTANVLTVGVNHLMIEIGGVETRMDSYLATIKPVNNLKQMFKPGNKMDVKILKIYDNGNSEVYVRATGRVENISDAASQMEEGGSYIGKVETYNPVTKSYEIRLDNGVPAQVKQEYVFDHRQLACNDIVSVLVKYVHEDHVIGKAIKL